jgi:hypothetical protein
MKEMKLGLRRGLCVGTVALAAALNVVGCGPDWNPPPPGPTEYKCTCECQNAVGLLSYPDTIFCTSPQFAQASCAEYCAVQEGQDLVCNDLPVVDRGQCGSTTPSGQIVSTGGDPAATEVTVDPTYSVSNVHHFGSTANPTLHGAVDFTGGCEMGICQILFNRILLKPNNFSLTVAGMPVDVENVTIESIGSINVIEDDGEFIISAQQLSVLVNGDVEGNHQTLVVNPDQDVSGFYLPSTGMFGLSGSFALSQDLSVDFSFETTLMARPPLVDRGPTQVQTVRADSTGYASVLLDGTGSHDLDNDLTEIAWYEGTTYLGSIAPTVNFPQGVHHLTAYAIDATQKWSSAKMKVIVLPPHPKGKP